MTLISTFFSLYQRCLRESGCLDLESLCIVSESVVWKIRLDITVLNHEGNVAECASVAGLAALAHFRRPDVTLKGDEVKVSESNRGEVELVLGFPFNPSIELGPCVSME